MIVFLLSEGTEIHGRRARYTFDLGGRCGMITEEWDNYPARSRLLAGTVARERFAIHPTGRVSRDNGIRSDR